jgi:putative ABC transport system permease protein
VIGLAVALAAPQLVKWLLFGVTPRDPVTLLAAPALLVAITLLASAVPAIRAAHVDPMIRNIRRAAQRDVPPT